MRFSRQLILGLMCWLALTAASQGNAPAVAEQPEVEWYIQDVVREDFVQHYDFEYYYTPSASDMASMRRKGEVSYMLNTPAGFTVKKARDIIDKIMASYEDISAVGEWHQGEGNYWKDFRFDKNKFHFSVRRKAVDDGGIYYVSVTEIPNSFKSLGKKSKKSAEEVVDEEEDAVKESKHSTKRGTRSRRKITDDDVEAAPAVDFDDAEVDETEDIDQEPAPAMSEKERARAAREAQKAREREEKALKHEQEKKAKAEEKARKAEEKKQKQEEERLRKVEEKRLRDTERQEKEAAKREQAKQSKKSSSKYHYTDVALWLSEKYGFTQISDDGNGTVMYSSAVTDADMAKLAIKNALKGSNARMAMPWRINEKTGAVETGYTVDGHVLVFAIGNDEAGHVTLSVVEVSGEDFEQFKSGLAND